MRWAFSFLLLGSMMILPQVRFGGETLAQSTGAQCPTVEVTCPLDWSLGKPVIISAEVRGAAPDLALTYNWTASAGVIIRGQGSNSVTIDTMGIGGLSVTATVEVSGIAGCSMIASCSLPPTEYPPPRARFFDQYGNLTFREEKQRLDNLAVELRRDPNMRAYIVIYHQQPSLPVEMLSRIRRVRDYLIKRRAIDAERVVFVDGGRRERLDFEIYLLPPNVIPRPYPIIHIDKEPASKRKVSGKGQTLSLVSWH